jgi:hypothetical protein
MKLLNDDELERSTVVANCRMNWERELSRSNGYSNEIGFNRREVSVALAVATSCPWLLDARNEVAGWFLGMEFVSVFIECVENL